MCWKKAKGDIYVKKGEILQVSKVNFSWEKPAHNVVIRDRNKPSLESAFGKVKEVKHLGAKSQAIKWAKAYMKKHDKC